MGKKVDLDFVPKGKVNIKDLLKETKDELLTDEEFKDLFRNAKYRKVKLK